MGGLSIYIKFFKSKSRAALELHRLQQAALAAEVLGLALHQLPFVPLNLVLQWYQKMASLPLKAQPIE